jgi:type IV pilus assembly protein PilM
MGLRIGRSRTFPIGLDIGSSAVKLAQLREVEDAHELVAAASTPAPPEFRSQPELRPDLLSRMLPPMLKSNAFQGRRCILSLPACHTFVQHVKLPKLPPQQRAGALECELRGKLPFDGDEAIIRHVVAGETPGEGQMQQELIAVAVSRRVLESYVGSCMRGGLDIVGVGVEASAIVECFSRLFRRAGDQARAVLFVDLGAASTQVVLAQGENMVFARNLAHGEQQLDAALAAGLSVSVEQAHSMRCDLLRKPETQAAEEVYKCYQTEVAALCEELTQCLRYYDSVFRNQPVERVIFVGGQAYDRRLCQMIAQSLNLPAQVGDPLVRVRRVAGAGLSIGLDRREPQPDWAVAVGLSLGYTKAA